MADPAQGLRLAYRALRPEATRLFRLLGLDPGPEFSLPVAAAVARASASLEKTGRVITGEEPWDGATGQ